MVGTHVTENMLKVRFFLLLPNGIWEEGDQVLKYYFENTISLKHS